MSEYEHVLGLQNLSTEQALSEHLLGPIPNFKQISKKSQNFRNFLEALLWKFHKPTAMEDAQ